MAFKGREARMSYQLAKIIPDDDPKNIKFNEFRDQFGIDDNIVIIAVQSSNIFEKKFINDWYDLGNDLQEVKGVISILSVPHSTILRKNKVNKNFDQVPLFSDRVTTNAQLDSLKKLFLGLPVYHNVLLNIDSNITVMTIGLDQQLMNSKYRDVIMDDVNLLMDVFAKKHQVEIHKSGLPYMRATHSNVVAGELKLFVILSMLLTAIVLFILFRNFTSVVLPLFVVGIAVIWSFGIMALFDYEITILTGLMPSLLIIIGIPNCVYLLNKYYAEYKKHGEKIKAVRRIIEKIGYVTLFTNLTTATGFGVFYFTDSQVLKEFGLVTSINIISTFLISLITVPLLLSFLPNPKSRHIMHLDFKLFTHIINKFNFWTQYNRKSVYLVASVLVIFSIIGAFKLKTTGHMFEDLPQRSKVYKDLLFFEQNFQGVLPFEVLLDTKKKGGTNQLNAMKAIADLQDSLSTIPSLSKGLSMVDGVRFANQSFFNGAVSKYALPNSMEKNFIFSYLSKTKGGDGLSNSFIDDDKQIARINFRMKDIGSHKLNEFYAEVDQKINAAIDTSEYSVSYTGTSLLVLEGNNYLINGLISSVGFAFILIALLMAYLFRSFSMLLISIMPNIIPLIFTAGVMGYFGIPLKPSTVLIFSIIFGISVDDTIHFLAKYKQELLRHNWNIKETVSLSLKETGFSMTYTSIILFFGFIVFVASDFKGTISLGLLSSITLIIAMLTNLILLPSLLLSFEKYFNRKALKKRLKIVSDNAPVEVS